MPKLHCALSGLCVFVLATAGVAGDLNNVSLQQIGSGFSNPLAVRSAFDGSDRLFVVEQDGLVRILRPNGAVDPTPFLDISGSGQALTNSSGERGLLGIAFHPNFISNGYVYVNYTDLNSPFNTIVARYTVSAGDADQLDPGTFLEIIRIRQDFSNHNGGDIHFGADGYLYIGMGDGGSGGDPCNRAQDGDPINSPPPDGSTSANNMAICNTNSADPTSALLGKMLRIDVDNAGQNVSGVCGAGTNYGIPMDNPFVGNASACDEIWAFGVRNPFRFSFDAITGDMYIGDVGQGTREEISFNASGQGGLNFGWDCREGIEPHSPASSQCSAMATYTEPLVDYQRPSNPCGSVTGGYRYRGPVPELSDTYLFGDFCTGEIYVASSSDGFSTFDVLIDPSTDASGYCAGDQLCLTAFGEDANRNVLVVDRNGLIYRFLGEDLIFADGFE